MPTQSLGHGTLQFIAGDRVSKVCEPSPGWSMDVEPGGNHGGRGALEVSAKQSFATVRFQTESVRTFGKIEASAVVYGYKSADSLTEPCQCVRPFK